MATVEGFPAIEYICENCGRNSFTSMIAAEMCDEELAALKQKVGAEQAEHGEFLLVPETVQCQYCGTIYDLARAVGDVDID